MSEPAIHTIDLKFLGRPGTIAAYLVPYAEGAILIECGPGSTIPSLLEGIKANGFELSDVKHVFLTHIHLDHAGAAGWMASQGCQIYVHEVGAPHLINPEKLLASAGRLYGERMSELWGEFLPVPAEKITILHDNDLTHVGELAIQALNVPGHASHHLAYLVGDACFTGDIGGIRLSPKHYLSLPMPPPDLNLEQWRASIRHIQLYGPQRIIPTHFGVYPDASWHLEAVLSALNEVETWVEQTMPPEPSIEELRSQFVEFEASRAKHYGVETAVVEGQQIANPSFMSADGLYRYWNKFRKPA